MWRLCRRMIVVAAALLATLAGAWAQGSQEVGWRLLTAVPVDPATKRQRIEAPSPFRLRGLRLELKAGALTLDRVTVAYGNGQRHFEDRRIVLARGERTKPIDLREEERVLEAVTLQIARDGTAAKAAEAARLELWGLVAADGPAAANAAAQAPAEAGGTVVVGRQQIELGAERAAIMVPPGIGKFSRLRLRPGDHDVEMRDVRVVYADGETDAFRLDERLAAGSRSRWLDVRSDRFIREVQIGYRARPELRATARVEIEGVFAEGWLNPDGEGRRHNQGWVLLGQQEAQGIGFERQPITVGVNEGGFREISIRARERAISVRDIRIVYADGEVEVIPVNATIEAGGQFGPVGIRGDVRAIREIQPTLRSRILDRAAVGRGNASVEVWAQHAAEATAGIAGSTRGAAPTATPRAAAPATEPQPKADDRFAQVPVFFGTNRQREDDRVKHGRALATFSGVGVPATTLGRAIVTVPTPKDPARQRQPGSMPRPEIDLLVIRVALRAEDPARDFTIQAVDVLERAAFIDAAQKAVAGAKAFAGQAFIFVHGYNVSFDDALFRTAQIAHDIGFDGLAATYSWPSKAGTWDYRHDIDRAREAREGLREFLELIARETGAAKLNLIAHSMGNDPLLEVLGRFGDMIAGGASANALKLNEIVLAAPDVSVQNFKLLARKLTPLAQGRVTLYASANDKALQVSKRVASGLVRAGDVPAGGPLVMDGIQTIDVTSASTDFLATNHSTFAERAHVLQDIALLFRSGKRPPSERSFVWQPVNGGAYWRYLPN